MDSVLASSLIQVAAIAVGVFIVVWQVGKQARYAIQQNRHNEALKLKLEVYNEIIGVCEAAIDANVSFSSYVRSLSSEIRTARILADRNLSPSTPKARVPTLIEKNSASDLAAIKIITVTEKWQIIDPRMDVFRTAMNVALRDVRAANTAYFTCAVKLMPHELPGGQLLPWTAPNNGGIAEHEKFVVPLQDALDVLGAYVDDFRTEMQNLLVGELFRHRVQIRQPLDPNIKVISLDRRDELMAFFENNTAWGKEKAAIEKAVKEHVDRKAPAGDTHD